MASIVFRNVRLIDSIADQPREGASIVVEGDRISFVPHYIPRLAVPGSR
jgi:hypothetical protein